MNNELKKIIKRYKKEGFEFIFSKHIKAIHNVTKKTVIIGSTPSDVRAYKNIESMLKKAMIA